MDLDKLIKELLDKKANENNTIDLNAYAIGMADLKKQLMLGGVSCQREQLMAMLTERILTIQSEPDGIVRETMINNLLIDINCN